jgi:hypothetical protein
MYMRPRAKDVMKKGFTLLFLAGASAINNLDLFLLVGGGSQFLRLKRPSF